MARCGAPIFFFSSLSLSLPLSLMLQMQHRQHRQPFHEWTADMSASLSTMLIGSKFEENGSLSTPPSPPLRLHPSVSTPPSPPLRLHPSVSTPPSPPLRLHPTPPSPPLAASQTPLHHGEPTFFVLFLSFNNQPEENSRSLDGVRVEGG